jgi:hypothetical protein
MDIHHEDDMESILSMMQGVAPFVNGMKLRDRKKYSKIYQDCFVGEFFYMDTGREKVRRRKVEKGRGREREGEGT